MTARGLIGVVKDQRVLENLQVVYKKIGQIPLEKCPIFDADLLIAYLVVVSFLSVFAY